MARLTWRPFRLLFAWAAGSALTHPARAFIGRLDALRELARLPQGFKDPCPVW